MDDKTTSRGSVLVTGGTIRIGAAIAARLRAHGWRVITSSHRADSGADLVADLAEPLAAARLYAQAAALAGGTLDAVVNNAALFAGDEATLTAVNLEAPRKLATMLAGREDGGGAVVNVVDLNVIDNAYGRTKRELTDFTRRGAALFAATLRMNAVAPGPVLAPTGVREKAGETLLDRRPTPDDVADAVAFLLEAKSVTGVVLPVDAGQHLLLEDRP